MYKIKGVLLSYTFPQKFLTSVLFFHKVGIIFSQSWSFDYLHLLILYRYVHNPVKTEIDFRNSQNNITEIRDLLRYWPMLVNFWWESIRVRLP